MDLIDNLSEDEVKSNLLNRSNRLLDKYNAISEKYHAEKADNPNNSLVLG